MNTDYYPTSGDEESCISIIKVSSEQQLLANEKTPLLLPDELIVKGGRKNDADSSMDQPPLPSGLLFFRMVHFLSGLSATTWGRFGVIYYNRVKHLTPQQIGVLQSVPQLLAFAVMPFWGYMADLVKSRKRVFLVCKTINTISLLCLASDQVDSFPKILVCVLGMALFKASGVLDAHTLDFLGEKHRSMYGTIREYNAISWGIGAIAMGHITDTFGFKWNFALFGIMMSAVLILTAVCLPSRSKSEQALYNRASDENDKTYSGPRALILREFFCQGPVILWLTEVAFIGIGISIVDSFLFVYLQNELNASTKLCGYTVGMTVLFQLPIFHYSQFLLLKMGHDFLFMLAMFCHIIRVFGFTLLTESNVNMVIFLEALHGITFACMWIASIDFAGSVAPEEWYTTVQAVLSITLTCLGGGIGPIVGGYIMENYGARALYGMAGCSFTVLLMFHFTACYVYDRGHDSFLRCPKNGVEDSPLSQTSKNLITRPPIIARSTASSSSSEELQD